ncbi:MAG: hypothetical protein JXB49_01050 [Bacteroidales bacterium]|nr:hypothetical protein [Bacteroidales bacterium]
MRKANYKKKETPEEIQQMMYELTLLKHPPRFHPVPRALCDDRVNSPKQSIIHYTVFGRGSSSRIIKQGTYNRRSVRFIPGTFRKGLTNIMIVYNRLLLHVEFRIGKESQFKAVRNVESDDIRTGGCYRMASGFLDFKESFDKLFGYDYARP